jgi:hypothetical protein
VTLGSQRAQNGIAIILSFMFKKVSLFSFLHFLSVNLDVIVSNIQCKGIMD